jgi:hypothetical protein
MATSTEKDTDMKIRSQKDISTKWDLYTHQQQADILAEFRKKLPDDYYCKTTLFEFLRKKITMEEALNKGNSKSEINRMRGTRT